MRKIIYILLILFCIDASAQNENEEVEGWNLDSLDFNDIDLEYNFYSSSGWFISLPFGNLYLQITTYSGWLNQIGGNVSSPSIINTNSPLNTNNFIEEANKEQLYSKDKWSNSDNENSPEDEMGSIGIDFKFSTGIPVNIIFGALYSYTNSLLLSRDVSKSFMSINGEKKVLNELNIFYMKDDILTLNAGIEIPIYGAHIETDDISTSSYYFLTFLARYDIIFDSEATQYIQIAKDKNEIRYANGTDIFQFYSEKKLPELNLNRLLLETNIGWKFQIGGISFTNSIFAMYNTTPMLKETNWRNYVIGLKTSIGLFRF